MYISTTFLTLDLDLEVFSINNKAHYRLSNIPRGDLWVEALRVDDDNSYFVHPSLAPEDSLASIAVVNRQFTNEDIELWDSLRKRKPWPKFPESTNLMALFQLAMFKALEEAELHHLDLTVLSWTVDDFAFREYAFCILCMASGGDNLSLIDQRRILGLKDKPLWNFYSAGISGNDAKGNREFF